MVENAGERIKRERGRRGLSQQALAELADIHPDTLLGVELGKHAPRPSTLRRLARALGMTVEELTAEEHKELAAPKV